MNRTNKILLIVLGIQIPLAILTWTISKSDPSSRGMSPVFDLEPEEITSFSVTSQGANDAQPETVTLTRNNDMWVVQSADDFPADKDKVKKVVDKLLELKVREPISSDAANHNALKVGKNDYARKVTLKSGDKGKSIVVGSGTGSSIHVRTEDEKDVYRSAGMSVWAITAGARGYIDTKYVNVDSSLLTNVMVANYKGTMHFTKNNGDWAAADLLPDAQLDQNKVNSFIGAISKVSMDQPVGKAVKPEYGLENGTSVTLTYTENDSTMTTTYAIGNAKDDNNFFAKSKDNDYVVTVSKAGTEQAREKSIEDLLKGAEPPAPQGPPGRPQPGGQMQITPEQLQQMLQGMQQ